MGASERARESFSLVRVRSIALTWEKFSTLSPRPPARQHAGQRGHGPPPFLALPVYLYFIEVKASRASILDGR